MPLQYPVGLLTLRVYVCVCVGVENGKYLVPSYLSACQVTKWASHMSEARAVPWGLLDEVSVRGAESRFSSSCSNK